jgi:hypothetical protein
MFGVFSQFSPWHQSMQPWPRSQGGQIEWVRHDQVFKYDVSASVWLTFLLCQFVYDLNSVNRVGYKIQ